MPSYQASDDVFFDDPDLEYHQDYRDGILSPYARVGFVLPFLLCLIPFIYQILVVLDYNVLSLPELVWNVLVYITPTRLLDAIDDYQNPLRIRNPALTDIPRTHAAKSEAMRRILGLDTPGGVIASVASASRRRLSILPGVKMLTASNDGGPAGLGNWDNSCYQNSVLQGLASLEPITEYLTNSNVNTELADGSEAPETKMAEALKGLIAILNDPNSNRKTIWTPATLKNMSSWQQQDAQEYFSKILDEIDKEMGSVARTVRKSRGFESYESIGPDTSGGSDTELSSANIYRNPLEGLMAQRVGCMTCGYSEGLQMVPFNCLTVPLTKAWSQSIKDCLDEVTKLEHIPGVECGKCTLLRSKHLLSIVSERNKDDEAAHARTIERLAVVNEALEDDDYEDKTLVQKCKIPAKSRVTSTKTRQAVIARPPRSLVVHFNRSVFDEMTGELRKNHAEVRFPIKLDLGPWCLGSGASTLEEWQLDPEKPMVASSIRPSRIKGPVYELRAVVTHYGRHENGHYICYKKHPVVSEGPESDEVSVDEDKKPREQWWRLSDDDVMKSSEQNVLGQGGVFMLFYDCIEPSSIVEPTTTSPNPITNIQPDHTFHGPIFEAFALPLPPDPPSSLLLDSKEAPAAAEIALPALDDSDLSDYHEESTSISDDEDHEVSNEEISYKPTQPIVVSPYIPQSGSQASKDGTSLEGSNNSLLMV
jgi:ubiquitin carboxyl-terminal hydrolase 1